MTGNLLGEPVEEFVIKEVKNRQKLLGTGIDGTTNRNIKQLNYINNRNAWVKLASSVSIDDINRLPINLSSPESYKGINLAKKAILFNGLSSLNNDNYTFRSGVSTSTDFWTNSLYGLGGTIQGIQPSPGITDVSVDSRNNGSIRTATISLKAYNRFQFEVIELLYLRLGFTLLLEFGWDKYLDKDGNPQNVKRTLIEDTFFKEQGTSQLDMLLQIKQKQEEYNGNYDGFFGRVKNFSWDFGSDGTYNIRLDLITLGDIIESLKINIPPTEDQKAELGGATSSEVKKYGENSVLLANRNNSKLAAYLYNTIGTNIHLLSPDYFNLAAAINARDADYNYNGEGRLDLNYNYYIRFGELIRILEQDIIPNIKPVDKQLLFESNALDTTLINYSLNLISFDPRVCIFKYDDGAVNQGDISNIYVPQYTKSLRSALTKPNSPSNQPDLGFVTENTNNSTAFVPTTSTNKQIKITSYNSSNGTVTLENGTSFQIDKNSGNSLGPIQNGKSYTVNDVSKLTKSNIDGGDLVFLKLYNIYLNYGFLFDVLGKNIDKEGNLSVFKFFQSVCDGINGAFANVTQITPTIKDDKVLTFVERKPPAGIIKNLSKIPGAKSGETVELKVFGFNKASKESNFLKNIKFNTKIGPKLANQISIGATAAGHTVGEDATAFSKWNLGLKDRFQIEVTTPSTTGKPTASKTNEDEKDENDTTTTTTQPIDNSRVVYGGNDPELQALFNGARTNSNSQLTAPNSAFNAALSIDYDAGSATRYYLNEAGERKRVNGRVIQYQFKIDKDGNIEDDFLYHYIKTGDDKLVQRVWTDGKPYYTRYSSYGPSFKKLHEQIQKAIRKKLREIYGLPKSPPPSEESSDAQTAQEARDQEVLDRTKKVANLNYSAYLAQMFGGTPNVSEDQTQSSGINIGTINKGQTQYLPKPNSEYVDMGVNAYKVYLQEIYGKDYEDNSNPSNQAGFIPVEFDITLDGLAGWLIYNKIIIQQSFLPAQYSATLEFLITGVSHKIGQDGWETNLKTLSTSNIDSPPSIKFNPAPKVSARTAGAGFSPGNEFTNNSREANALKLKNNSSVPVENGFLHKYPGMLVEADSSLYSRLRMANSSDNYKLRLHYAAMPHFINLVNAYEKAISENGKTFLERYGKLKINSGYRSISSTPGGGSSAAPGSSRHGLGLAVDLQQPASYKEVHEWFLANAPSIGWMRIPILRNGTNETWHWELQYEGKYAKLSKDKYFMSSNIKNYGKNGQSQYSISYKQATGVDKIKPSYILNQSTWEAQKINQIT